MSDDRVAVEVGELWPDDVEAAEGVVVDWFVREGSQVDEGKTLCNVQIEKVDVDILSPASGTLAEIVRGEDDEFERGDTLAWIDPE